MPIYFDTLQQFIVSGGLKSSTITAKQLLPAVVAHMQRMDRKFTLQVNGRLPKSMDALLGEVFELCHLQQPFYTQHCATRASRYMNVSKSRVKIDFTLTYRMSRDEEKWVVGEIQTILLKIITTTMTDLEKVIAVHDYIIRTYQYEMNTQGSPFTVYTFMHEKQGVCMAYALLFEKMMEELGIPCYYVVGKAEGEGDLGHAWNMVQLDGEWYHVDATWDDLGSRTAKHEIRYRYFLRTDDFMKGDHQWNLDHYPMCTSQKYEKLANLYDAALYEGRLYFPHPKTAVLTSMDLSKLVFKREHEMRVQYCSRVDKKLYLSNFSDQGYLYSYHLESKELVQLSTVAVQKISADKEQLIATFVDKSQLVLEEMPSQDNQTKLTHYEADEVVPLIGFGTSYFGEYKGKTARVLFEHESGLKLYIQDEIKQLSVDVLWHAALEITFKSGKRDTQFQQPAILILPNDLFQIDLSEALQSYPDIQYQMNDQTLELTFNKSISIQL